ncbi:DMT family transporter [Saccharospirillum mangrovi]|uniref:DMT family transporter n=1 Tax=Saccharospirillum mangrovi TaxID=2161747 RepID=UPI000D3D198E|nr:DMT family transporter [Saccharospirillum mangrovi]
MSLAGFLLVFCAALCHAFWNFLLKRINGDASLTWLFSALTVVIYLPLAIYFAWDWRGWGWLEIGFIVGSAVIHIGYFLLLQQGYRVGDLSVVYPTARATGPLISTVLAVLLFGEHLNHWMAAGIALILIGVLNLSRKPGSASRPTMASMGFGVLVGLLIGTYTLWDAHAVAALMIPPLLLDYGSNIVRSVLLTPLAIKRWPTVKLVWQQHRWKVLGIALFSPLAYILVLTAMTFTPLVYVAPTREISVLFSVLLGSLLLDEGYLRHRLKWALVMLFGVVILL